MHKVVIHTELAPQAIGKYSQAIRTGNTVFISGQLGIVPGTAELVPGFSEQTHRALCNLDEICKAAGGNLGSIVRLGVFLTDISYFSEFNDIMGQYFSTPYPARVVIQVSGLPRGGLIETDAIMVIADE